MKFAILRVVYNSYAFAPILDKIRPAIRYSLFSFSGLASLIPHGGRVLDVGCGDGLLAVYLKKILNRTQAVVGIDIDKRKIRIAEQLELSDVQFQYNDVAAMPSNSFDVVTIVHVMYLIPLALRPHFLQQCVRVLKPLGTLVVAVNSTTPTWKYYFSFVQELIMVKLLGLTAGGTMRFQSIEECEKWIASAGAAVSRVMLLDRGRPYSHVALVAQKRSDA
jgi:2-polyprenyl-3-methyl-5-hydroxy-6-metoxy-1,4-benzoquinol methylase